MKSNNLTLLIIALIINSTCFVFNCSAQYSKLYDFSGSDGSWPTGDLISDGTFLYGMTQKGGTIDSGIVFKIKPDGTGYLKLLDFAGVANGKDSRGSLISDGTFLYGMTREGGTNNIGVIFKIKPDGTAYDTLLNFTGVANGKAPSGSLISDGVFLYGMAGAGGTNNMGVIFKIKSDGTGYTKLLDFTGTTNGSAPLGSLIFDGTFLYGMTMNGGTNNMGVIFKIKPDGTNYSKLFDFTGTVNGQFPMGSLISDGTFLYGMTYLGGTSSKGVIFKIKLDGTNYTKLLDFNNTNGLQPHGSLISDGIFLYGMAVGGGTNNVGVIFKIKPDGTAYDTLLNFAGTSTGALPNGSLISDGSFLYGMTKTGGTYNKGTVFKLGFTTGITESNMETAYNIYPNPTNGLFTMQIDNGHSIKGEIEICNVLGEKIYSMANTQLTNKVTIDISNQPKGIYFLQVKTGQDTVSKKIIISY